MKKGKNNKKISSKSKNQTKEASQEDYSINISDVEPQEEPHRNEMPKQKVNKNKICFAIGIVILIAVSIYYAIQPKEELYFFNDNYVLKGDNSIYIVNAGDSAILIDGNKILKEKDTFYISKDKILAEQPYKAKPISEILTNQNVSNKYWIYHKKEGQSFKIRESKHNFKPIDGEMFEISEQKEANNYLISLGANTIQPQIEIDTLSCKELRGHEQISIVHFCALKDSLLIEVTPTKDLKKVEIFSAYEDCVLGEIQAKNFGKLVIIPLKSNKSNLYRIVAKNHVSYLIKAEKKCNIIRSDKKIAQKQDGDSVWKLIALLETLFIILFFIIRKILNNKKKQKKKTNDMSNLTEKMGLQNELNVIEDANTSNEIGIHDNKKDEIDTATSLYGVQPKSDEEKIKWVKETLQKDFEDEKYFIDYKKNLENLDEGAKDKYILYTFEEFWNAWKKTKKIDTETAIDNSSCKEDSVKGDSQDNQYLQKEIENLNLPQNELTDSLAHSQEIEKLKIEIQSLKKSLEESEQEIKNTTVLKDKNQLKLDKVTQDYNILKESSEKIEQRVKEECQAKIDEQKIQIESLTDEKDSLKNDLTATRTSLEKIKNELSDAKNKIIAKENALERFSRTITDIAPIKQYALYLEQLLNLGDKVEKCAISLLSLPDIEDDYLINKYITRFRASMTDVDMQMFITDALNAAKAQFAYKTQLFANYDQKDPTVFHESVKMYFFDTYLKKYLDALVVFNETMIGMQFLTDGISEQAVTKFIKIRKELQNVINKLEIEVISVKIMDSCEDNLSLSVMPKSLDFDCPQNSICQIDNCIVFLKGSNLPNEKIKVIVKK